MRKRNVFALIGVGAALLTATIVSVTVAEAGGNAPSSANGETASAIPPALPSVDGLSPSSPSWTLVSSSSSPLWIGEGSSPFDATALGLDGGLLQLWVSNGVASQYGIGSGLTLPVPLAYAQANPGPVEAVVRILSFSSPEGPSDIYGSEAYSQLGSGNSDIQQLSSGGLNGGRVIEISSAANGGLTEYQFQWTTSTQWIEVSVLGASLSVPQAQSVAESVGA